jgi:hypothetical protein
MGKAFMKLHMDILGPSYEGTLEIREMFDAGDGHSADAQA